MKNSVVVVTGSNIGIGKETAAALATMGATTVLACRNRAKAETAATEIRGRAGNDDVHVVDLDLADLRSVTTCAATILDRWDRLDVLVNNAGGIWSERQTTVQGFEQTFGVNHLAPFSFTHLLLERLVQSGPARIVNVSSIAHHAAFRGMRWEDLQGKRRYRSMQAYAQSKLANILFTRGLAARLDPARVTANAVHPGPVRTGFGMDGDMNGIAGLGNRIIRPFEVSPEAGAATSIFLAAHPSLAGCSGGYWARSRPARMSAAARDDAAVERLWSESERVLLAAGFETAPLPI